jgi:hypothetical protein
MDVGNFLELKRSLHGHRMALSEPLNMILLH